MSIWSLDPERILETFFLADAVGGAGPDSAKVPAPAVWALEKGAGLAGASLHLRQERVPSDAPGAPSHTTLGTLSFYRERHAYGFVSHPGCWFRAQCVSLLQALVVAEFIDHGGTSLKTLLSLPPSPADRFLGLGHASPPNPAG